ncbi:MAG: T9SS type A sorting domain-containing protein [Ignavibacteriaceae bacterium]
MKTSILKNLLISSEILLLLSLLISIPLYSQISITQSEMMEIFIPGNPLYVIYGESGLINIGKNNGPNEYDFTQIDTQNVQTFQNFSVSQLPPLSARYPSNATTMGEGPQNIVENPIFLWDTDSTFFLGQATIENEYRFLHYIPSELFVKYPIEINPPSSNFTQVINVYDTTYNLNWQVQDTDQYNTTVDVWIDGYGTLKLPGLEVECLRMKREYSWFQYKEFFYLTKEGILLVVSDVASSAPDTGYVLGDYSVLSNEPIVGVENEQSIPIKFFLQQNYPNPFNPTTWIRFSVPETQFVTFKVFDILGDEVETLVNEELPSGEYEVQFNSHSSLSGIKELTSGIYFYQLKAGSFIQTKKMILLK